MKSGKRTRGDVPTPEQLEDELILAAILSGAETCGRKVQPHNAHDGIPGSDNLYGTGRWQKPDGPCCAVGVGVLYAGVEASNDPPGDFAEKYGVSRMYAHGVSTGFESPWRLGMRRKDSDYKRGIAVGRAVFDALYNAKADK